MIIKIEFSFNLKKGVTLFLRTKNFELNGTLYPRNVPVLILSDKCLWCLPNFRSF